LKRSNRVLLLLGVALAVVAFVGVLAVGSLGQAPVAPALENVTVVVAAQELPLGTRVSAEMLRTEERPVPQAADSFRTPEELNGSVIRRSVPAGHVLRTHDFQSATGQSDVGASLPAGLRGIAVSLDQVDGVGYLLQAGDFVDVVLTVTDDNPVVVANPRYPSEAESPLVLIDDMVNNTTVKVLVQNVQVLSVVDPNADTATNEINGVPQPAATMIAVLAVTPQQAELVRFAETTGDVSLTLRSPGDRTAGEVPTTGITLAELVARWGVLPPAPVNP
jgi:pilus assembly protein CpaB